MALTSERADVVIIGGGIMGTVAAFHLSRAGRKVILLEARRAGWSSSGVNEGGVRRQGRHPAELPLAQESLKEWGDLPSLVGTNFSFVPCGNLKAAESEAELQRLADTIPYHAEAGVPLELLDRDQMRRTCPGIRDSVVGGALCRGDGLANPRLVSPTFARKAMEMGAVIRENEPVRELECAGRRVEAARTARGIYRGEMFLNVAGAWGPRVAEMAGERLNVGFRCPQVLVTEKIRKFLGPVLSFVNRALSLKQVPQGNLVIGGSSRRNGVGDPATFRKDLVRGNIAGAAYDTKEVFPFLKKVTIIRAWTGIEGEPEDKIPVIDRSPSRENLLYAFGFSGHGFQLGLCVGRLLARWVLEGRPFLPIEAFNARRVLKG